MSRITSNQPDELYIKIIESKDILQDRDFRGFGRSCSLRLKGLFNDDIITELYELSDKYIEGKTTEAECKEFATRYQSTYAESYPGDGAPSAFTLAINSIATPIFMRSPMNSAIHASASAAQAFATLAAGQAEDSNYDNIYEETYLAERKKQLDMFNEITLRG